ncbi:MAG: AI-2E family transporter [Hahellaceae bacterium]|jgi:predicted PurR-regulated permease PerM|nr:AI-2E family transporter [Hahellaceae bacterium]
MKSSDLPATSEKVDVRARRPVGWFNLIRRVSFFKSQAPSDDSAQILIRIEIAKLFMLGGLCIIVLGAVMREAAFIFIPLTLAWFLSALFSPLIKYLQRNHIPPPMASAFLVVAIMSSLLMVVNMTIDPAAQWIEELPASLRHLRVQLAETAGPLSDLQEVSREVKELATMAAVDSPLENLPKVALVEESGGTMKSLLIDDLPDVTSMFLMTMAMTYFILASNDQILRSLVSSVSTFGRRRRLVRLSRAIKAQMTTYLRTVSIINLLLAMVVALVLWLLDAPNPLLWGTLAGLLNFAPFVGPAVMTFLLLLVGVTSSNSLQEACVLPGAFLVLTAIEGQLITPSVLGKKLALSPMLVFLGVVVMTWLWGPIGALMASPLLAAGHILWKSLSDS